MRTKDGATEREENPPIDAPAAAPKPSAPVSILHYGIYCCVVTIVIVLAVAVATS